MYDGNDTERKFARRGKECDRTRSGTVRNIYGSN